MIGDTYKEQLEKTKEVNDEDMEYFCIAAFGEKEVLHEVSFALQQGEFVCLIGHSGCGKWCRR